MAFHTFIRSSQLPGVVDVIAVLSHHSVENVLGRVNRIGEFMLLQIFQESFIGCTGNDNDLKVRD
jgi:hypothetical protein